MKFYRNLKISAKLLTGFILVAIIAGIVGITGINDITLTNRKYTDLFEEFGVPLGDIGGASTDFQIQRSLMRQVIIDKGVGSRDYIDKIKQYQAQMDSSLEAFQKSIQTQEVQSEFDNLKSLNDKFRPICDKVISLATSNQIDQAISVMKNEGAPVADSIENSINKLTQEKITIGRQRSDQYSSDTRSTIAKMILFVLIAMAMAFILGIFISNTINRPIKKLVQLSEEISEGDLNVNIEAETKDEIGKLQQAFKKMVENTNEVMLYINEAADQVASGAKQVSDSSIELSQGATEQASSLEELTASIEELSSQTKLNAENANKANTISEKTKMNASSGNEQMKAMLNAMAEINEASGSISKIIKVIDDIAFQTNILALNAAVEAARAGQHGKGFAVVAEEVRNLAARSANAAKETTALIESSIGKVDYGIKIANDTASALGTIIDDISKAAALVNEISIASNEQAIGIEQVSLGLNQLSAVVQSNSSTSEESAASSEELSSQAELLKEQVNKFKLKKPRNVKSEAKYECDSEPSNTKAPKNPEKETEKLGARVSLSDNEFGKY